MIKKICDFCGAELKGWEDECNSILISVSQSGNNPLEIFDSDQYQGCEVSRDDICFSCIRKLSKGIAELLETVKKEF